MEFCLAMVVVTIMLTRESGNAGVLFIATMPAAVVIPWTDICLLLHGLCPGLVVSNITYYSWKKTR
jgi:hypothetical protein